MDSPVILIIDEEWPDYEIEKAILQKTYKSPVIRYSTYDNARDLADFGHSVDAVICQVYAHITKDMLDKLPKLKAIAVYGGGYDRVDIKAAKERGIMVTNVSGYCAEDIADYVLAGIFHFNKRFTYYDESIKKGLWGAQAVFSSVRRIEGAVLLIVGLGRIGRTVARRAKAAGLLVTAYDPYVDAGAMEALGVRKVALEEGLKEADFVSIHAIYNEETHALLSYRHFKMMKRSAYLINTARGAILAEDQLIKAAFAEEIKGALLDVIVNEPPSGKEPILSCPRVIVTPHISYISDASYRELKKRTVENVIKMLKGERPADLVSL